MNIFRLSFRKLFPFCFLIMASCSFPASGNSIGNTGSTNTVLFSLKQLIAHGDLRDVKFTSEILNVGFKSNFSKGIPLTWPGAPLELVSLTPTAPIFNNPNITLTYWMYVHPIPDFYTYLKPYVPSVWMFFRGLPSTVCIRNADLALIMRVPARNIIKTDGAGFHQEYDRSLRNGQVISVDIDPDTKTGCANEFSIAEGKKSISERNE